MRLTNRSEMRIHRHLQVVTLIDKVAAKCLNTKSRGCPVTELAMMSWKRRASCSIA